MSPEPYRVLPPIMGIRMQLTGLDLPFWAAGFVAHSILLFVLWVRKRAIAFPVFTGLIALNVARTISLYFVQITGTKVDYFYTYWSLAIVDVAFQLGVIYEVSSRIFRSNGNWAIDARGGLVTWICGSLLVAGALTWIPTPPTNLWMQVVFIKGSFFSAALLSELFVGMILLSATAGIPWTTHVARISGGLGFYSVVTVLVSTGNTYFGLKSGSHPYNELERARMTVYLGCVVYWIIVSWLDAPPMCRLTESMRQQILVAQGRATEDLKSLKSRKDRWK
jgi:hypothetical protein